MFISLSSTCIPNFSKCHALFVFLSHSASVAALCGIQRVDPQMILFQLFYHLVRRSQFNTKTIFVQFRQLKKKNILGIHPKQIIIPAPFHSKAFAILYKSETSWELLGRLSRSFLSAISGASNFKHSLLMTLSGLANYVRVSSSSLLFCIQPSLKLFQLLFSGLLVFPFLSCCKNFHFSMIILPPMQIF